MLEHNNVYLGDCLEVMKGISDQSVDLVLCDLPYGITKCAWDTPIDMDLLWPEYKRVIRSGGAIILTATMPFGARLIMSNPKWFRHELIWEKDNGSNPFNANICPMRVHENILVFCERGTIYNPQKPNGHSNYVRVHQGKINNVGKHSGRIDTINHGDRFPRSVLKFKKDYGKLIHSTQKPVALFEWLIKTYSNDGDLVLDNCSGSGTTAIAAINSGRNYLCIEKDEKYFQLSQERILKHPQANQNSSESVR